MKDSRGFTIVEIAVVIAIVGLLFSLVGLGFNRTLTDSRNNSADSKTAIIASALEKYYTANGEYPTCANITQASATVVATYLVGVDPSMLTRDGAGTAAGTNSISCSAATTDNFSYTSTATTFTLSYVQEGPSGATISRTGKHN